MSKYGIIGNDQNEAKMKFESVSCEDYDYQIKREKKNVKKYKKTMSIITDRDIYLNSIDKVRNEIVGEIVLRILECENSIKETKRRKARNKEMMLKQRELAKKSKKSKKSKRQSINEKQ